MKVPASLLVVMQAGCEPAAADTDPFNCGWKKLAYEYGKQLLPWQGNYSSLYYALNLNDRSCSAELEAASVPVASADIPAGAVFVDASKGKDSNAGTEEAPLQSIAAAVSKAPSGTVVLREGTFWQSKTLQLGSENSGLKLMAYPNEHPVISGGKQLKVTWQPHDVSDSANIYSAKLQGQVSEVPGLQLNGERATRARYPNLPGGIEVSPGLGAMVKGNAASWAPPNFSRLGPVQYYTDTKHSRNDTQDGIFQNYMIGTNGLCSVYDPPVGYWCSEHTSGGGAFAFRTPSGVTPNQGALPNAPYKDVSEMIINVWRPNRWENWMFQVADYDPAAGSFVFGAGGNQGARGENRGDDFFVENVMEELDHPGEFFYNKKSDELFLYYNGTGAPPSDLEIVVPSLRVLMNVSGTQWDPVRNLTLSGLTFKSTRHTYMDPHLVPSGGDVAVARTGAVFVEGAESFTVESSTFERIDGNALTLSGYNRYATVQGCDFSFIGDNAMVSLGYTNETENSGFPYYRPQTGFPAAGIDGTDGNHPRYNQILGNSAREVGLYEKQSSFYMQSKTAQSTIAGNVFFNGPRSGIQFNDGFGGGDEVGLLSLQGVD